MKNKRVQGIAVLLFCVFVGSVTAQQLPEFSQYMFSAFLLNPAAAGSEGYTSVNLVSRRQWMNVPGAPETDGLSVQTRLYKRSFIRRNNSPKKRYAHPNRSGRVGLGFYFFCDRANVLLNTGGQFTYAYHLTIEKSQLSFGLTGGIYQFSIDRQKVLLDNSHDELLEGNPLNAFYPDFDAGVYYTTHTMYLGVSVNHLTQASASFGSYKGTYRLYRQYNLTSGVNIPVASQVVLQPSAYLKGVFRNTPQLDLTIKSVYAGQFWGGVTWRTGKILIGMVGCKFQRAYFGYSYDYHFNSLAQVSGGTHEVMMALKLGDNTRRYRWIERY